MLIEAIMYTLGTYSKALRIPMLSVASCCRGSRLCNVLQNALQPDATVCALHQLPTGAGMLLLLPPLPWGLLNEELPTPCGHSPSPPPAPYAGIVALGTGLGP